MSMQYIRDYYGVPAKLGGRIRYSGAPKGGPHEGTIVSSQGARLGVRFDGAPFGYGEASVILHPTWKVEYLNEAAA